MLQNVRIAVRLAVGIVLMIAALIAIMLPAGLGQLNRLSQQSEIRQLESLHSTLQANVKSTAAEALTVATAATSAPAVEAAFAQRDRAKLTALTLPTFEALKKEHNVKQFQFHTPDGRSFLRLHDLGKYGDSLTSFRATVVDANRTHQPQSGLENGVAGLGLRGVLPIYYQGQHVGSAEIGLSFGKDFFTKFSNSYHAPAAVLLPSNGGFTAYASTIPSGYNLSKDQLASVMSGKTVSNIVKLNGKQWMMMAQPLHDYSGKPMGVLELMVDRSAYVATYRQTLTRFLLGGVAALLAGLALAVAFSRTISRPIAELTDAAEKISRGDFEQPIQGTERQDEIGSLARAVERMEMSIQVAMNHLRKTT